MRILVTLCRPGRDRTELYRAWPSPNFQTVRTCSHSSCVREILTQEIRQLLHFQCSVAGSTCCLETLGFHRNQSEAILKFSKNLGARASPKTGTTVLRQAGSSLVSQNFVYSQQTSRHPPPHTNWLLPLKQIES